MESSVAEKRKRRKDSSEHRRFKRAKTEQEVDEAVQERPSASPRVSIQLHLLQQPITLSELTELLHFAALGKEGGLKQPSWCRLHCQREVKGLNVVIVDGLTQTHFYRNYFTMEHLRTNYTTRITFTPSSNNVASEIFSSEVPKVEILSVYKQEQKLQKALKHHPVITTYGTQRRGLSKYILTTEEMIKNHFPVKGMPGFEDFRCTKNDVCVTDNSPLYGLDCEMCLTEKGYELTRVSLVDGDGNCVLDELVKPQRRVRNYLTKFSGVTAAMLQPITTTLRDVQTKLMMLLPGDAVLVGHSLNSDLIALKLIHPHVVDTSLLYRRQFGQRFKLKVLADIVLKRQIQTEERIGHNPTEDAVAALELAQYFIKTGPRQVVELHLEELWGYKLEESSEVTSAPVPSHRFADILQALGRSVAFLGNRADIALNLSNQQWFSSDREVVSSFRRQTKCRFLSILQLPSFSHHLRRRVTHQEQLYQNVCAELRDMCVVFAGPFPSSFSEKEVKRLFRCCGRVRKVQMLKRSVRVHAEVEFEMLEGATLALKVLDRLSVHGRPIKVQRPVHESMLDLDLNLEALMRETLNTYNLYAVKLSRHAAQRLNISPKTNGLMLDAQCAGASCGKMVNGLQSAKLNGEAFDLPASSELSEETVRETFSHFGTVQSIILPAKPTKHICIKFKRSEAKRAALGSSEDLLKDRFLICPSVTPPHLLSWATMTTDWKTVNTDEKRAEEQRTAYTDIGSQDQEIIRMMRKLDIRLRKVFKSLPDGTLSVVVLLGQTRVVKTAEKITGTPLPSLQSIYHCRVHRRAASIIKDPTHPSSMD